MALTLDLPISDAAPPAPADAATETPEAAAAAAVLETSEESTHEAVTIMLLLPVTEPLSGFAAEKGQTFDARIDEDGATYIPYGPDPEGAIYLESKEFKIVETPRQTEPKIDAPETPKSERKHLRVMLMRDMDLPAVDCRGERGQIWYATQTPDGVALNLDSGCRVVLDADDFEIVGDNYQDHPATAGGCAELHSDQAANGTPLEPASQPVVAVTPKLSPRERYIRDKSAMEERLGALTIEEMKLKEQAKLCKKEREVLAEQLSNLIDGWERDGSDDQQQTQQQTTNQQTTPATAAAGGAGDTTTEGRGQSPDAQPASPPAVVDPPAHAAEQAQQACYHDVLRRAALVELTLAPNLHDKLADSGVATVWDLEMLRADISQGKKQWPKGIGKAKVSAVEDALMAWMTRNAECWQAPTTERTAADIDASNQAIEDQQDAERAKEVAQTSVDHAKPEPMPVKSQGPAIQPGVDDRDPLDDL